MLRPPVQVVVDLGGGTDHSTVEKDGEDRGLEVALAEATGLVVEPEQRKEQRRDYRVDAEGAGTSGGRRMR